GYVTVIRNNWHLLRYEQLLELLNWSAERLNYTLKEEDFLWHKLGDLKPETEFVCFEELTVEQIKQTAVIKNTVEKDLGDIHRSATEPFSFMETFSRVEEIRLQSYGKAEDGEILLDGTWRISYPCYTYSVCNYVNNFIDTHKKRWGMNLAVDTTGAKAGHMIELVFKHVSGLPPESHSLSIEKNFISIEAVGEEGLLRGLQWLENCMQERDGPFLRETRLKRNPRFDLRLIYPYHILYGDSFLDQQIRDIPEGLLRRYSKLGINGIWLPGLLYTLVPLKKMPEISDRYEERLANMRRLAEWASKYGIGVYLYLNEPRGMKPPFFEAYPAWKGVEYRHIGTAGLCTSAQEVRDFLRNGTAAVFAAVPELAGVFTITASENPTNCWSHKRGEECPRCSGRSPYEVVAEVNQLIEEGVHSVKPDARVMAWTWGWNPSWIKNAIELLPASVTVMCTSEEGVPTDIGGIKGKVADYSMSQTGPGERAQEHWQHAQAKGLKTIAKLQANTTWECSPIPYLPVMNLLTKHLQGIADMEVSGLMLSWTLGGYPSLNLEMASCYYWDDVEADDDNMLSSFAVRKFGGRAASYVCEAWEQFDTAFREFPFDVNVLYLGPQNLGPANLLFEHPSGYNATMVGLPYDDLESWRSIYPEEIFIEQLRKLSVKWKKGLEALDEARAAAEANKRSTLSDLICAAQGSYLHFRSAYLQAEFVRLRWLLEIKADKNERLKYRSDIRKVLKEEIELAVKLHNLVKHNSLIGFEATNHYAYTVQDLREKVINCRHLLLKVYGREEDDK
ncbi:MAG: hypothetical protein PHT33_15445, partial [bacterium]|nr:hypothetical protein [bacterium]